MVYKKYWTSVNEKLPEPGQRVRCLCDSDGDIQEDTAYIVNVRLPDGSIAATLWECEPDEPLYDVIAWRPIKED